MLQFDSDNGIYMTYSLNDLCSVDSRLWQFVEANELQNIQPTKLSYAIDIDVVSYSQFLTMLSSIQKDKEKFILENIKL